MSTERPIVFLAFADAKSDLSSLKVEGWSLKDEFDKLKQRGVIADVVVEEKASLERIYAVFLKHRDRIAIFHFGGHADGDRLLLESDLESAFEPRPAYAEGLATLLGQQRGLKLVFLNGCSTRPQVKRLLDAGVPAVIATAQPIADAVATEFAVAFYEALTTGYSGEHRKISGGCSIERAFAEAEGFSKAARGGKSRNLAAATPAHEDVGFDWKLEPRPGSEHILRWNLFQDDPLFGLPDVPADIGWPVEPYRNLEYFHRDHARIFFGRGRAIRELFNLIDLPAESAESRLIFYYGQTGVGKTSVLAAGLLPRVETLFATRYCRRSAQDGLLGTLQAALAPGAKSFNLGASWLEVEREAQRPLLIVLDQAEEAFTRPRADSRPHDEVRALFEAVREAFAPTRTERPRGRLILSFRKEWLAEFDELRKASNLDIKPMMLDPLDGPGVIEAIEEPVDHFGLVIMPDRDHVKPGEATLAEFMTVDLFDTLANPQTEQESPIAPTLQILLTRMWKEANDPKRRRGRPTFDRALYQELKGMGFKLDEVVQEQLGKIAEVEGLREAVEKGLLPDLLEFFTTREGTADTHTRQQIHDRYKHKDQPLERLDALLDALLDACQNRYLLAHVGVGADGTPAYRLTHDTLAPLLRERFRVSPALAQRARRLLEGRAATWTGKTTEALDHVDLESVEKGLPWMRALEQNELDLLEASRKEEDRRKAEEEERKRKVAALNRRILQATLIGLGVSLTLLVLFGWKWREATVQTGRAQEQTEKAKESAKEADAQRVASRRTSARAALDLGLVLCQEGRVDRGLLWLGRSLEEAPGEKEAPDDATAALRRTIRANLGAWSRQHHALKGWLDHKDGVNAVAFSPDGKRILTGTGSVLRDQDRGEVWLWDAATGKPIGHPLRHHEEVNTVAFSPDGRRILTGTGDGARDQGEVWLWDAATGMSVWGLKLHRGRVNAVAFSTDGRTIVTGSQDRKAQLWDIATGQEFGHPMEHPAYVEAVAFSPDGKTIVTGADDDSARIWDVSTRQQLRRLEHARPANAVAFGVSAVAFSPDGRTIVTGCGNSLSTGEAHFWDVTTDNQSDIVLHHSRGVAAVAFSPDGRTLVTGSFDNTARLWEVATGEQIGQPLRHRGGIHSVAFDRDGRTVVTGGSDGTARLWDVTNDRRPGKPRPQKGEILAVAFNTNGQIVLSTSEDRASRAELRSATTGKVTGESLDHHGDHRINVGAFSHEGNVVVTGSANPSSIYNEKLKGNINAEVRLWDASTGKAIGEPLPHPDAVFAVDVSDDRKTVVTGCDDKYARLWDAEAGTSVWKIPHKQWVRAVSLSPDGQTIATGTWGSEVERAEAQLWNAATHERIGKPMIHQGGVLTLAFSPDGRIVATGGYNETVQLWDATTGGLVGKSLPHRGVDAIAFSHDGQTIVTGSSDDTARLWDVGTGKPIGGPMQHQVEVKALAVGVKAVAFGLNDRTVLTGCQIDFRPGSEVGVTQLWDVPAPIKGRVDQIVLWTQLITGEELDSSDTIQELNAAKWYQLRHRLEELGGPPSQ